MRSRVFPEWMKRLRNACADRHCARALEDPGPRVAESAGAIGHERECAGIVVPVARRTREIAIAEPIGARQHSPIQHIRIRLIAAARDKGSLKESRLKHGHCAQLPVAE
jgi:hypothetical protein